MTYIITTNSELHQLTFAITCFNAFADPNEHGSAQLITTLWKDLMFWFGCPYLSLNLLLHQQTVC